MDEAMQVRRAVSTSLKGMVGCIGHGYSEKEAAGLLQALANDGQDLVRFPCVEALLALCTAVPSQVIAERA